MISVGEKPDTVRKYIASKGYSILNIVDPDKIVSAQYGIRSHPIKFLINKEGKLVGMSKGYRAWDSDEVKNLISALIQN